MIAENRQQSQEHHSDKTMRLLRHKLLSSCLIFISRFDDFIIWYTILFPHQMKSECQCCSICSAADVNPLFWFWHNFNTDLPTCANWTPDGAITGLTRVWCDQWEDFIVTDWPMRGVGWKDVPCDHNIPCAIRLPSPVSHPTTINIKIDLSRLRIKELNMKTWECVPDVLSPLAKLKQRIYQIKPLRMI